MVAFSNARVTRRFGGPSQVLVTGRVTQQSGMAPMRSRAPGNPVLWRVTMGREQMGFAPGDPAFQGFGVGDKTPTRPVLLSSSPALLQAALARSCSRATKVRDSFAFYKLRSWNFALPNPCSTRFVDVNPYAYFRFSFEVFWCR